MRTSPWRRSRPAPEPIRAELHRARTNAMAAQRADCCVASAAYRVLLPATRLRPRPAELLLCAHHYRSSRQALAARRAAVFDAEHRVVNAEE